MSIGQVGGFSALIAQTPSEKFQLVLEPRLVTLIFTNLVMTTAGANFWQRAFAAKDRKSALRGHFGGTVVYSLTHRRDLVPGPYHRGRAVLRRGPSSDQPAHMQELPSRQTD